jgi:CPA2 family monovalent cation:H+ antiporter-2
MDLHQQAVLETMALVLCAAAVTTVVFQRLRQPVVLGYLLAGMLVSRHVPFVPLLADDGTVHTLAELGVILLMFSLGIEFSLPKLLRVGATAGFVAIVQCSVMIWLGYLAGQAFGWSRLASFYAGAAIAISSTTIIVKAFAEQNVRGDFVPVVFGVLIVEDLIAILLITILTTLSHGEQLSAMELALTVGRLAAFLCVLVVVGLFTVPRLMRAVVRLDRAETTIVASVGLAFGLAALAAWCDYSVALGAFLAGSFVAESGVEKQIEHAVQPVRDIFAAIFFVSVGMMIDPLEIAADWPLVLAFFAAVVVGNVCAVTISAFLTGQSVQSAVKTGMSMAQIGEFSFIIANVGVATGVTASLPLYSVAVAVSALTTLLTPWLIQSAEPTAAWIDRKLPRSLQTFVALYGSWLEQLRRSASTSDAPEVSRLRTLARWLAVDTIVVAMVIIGASVEMESVSDWAQDNLGIGVNSARFAVVGAAFALSSPFWIGMIRVARYLGFALALRAFPSVTANVDLAAAPRRLLVVTLQLAILLFVGFPLVAVTQPFVPPFRGFVVLAALLAVSAMSFWRGALNFQGHTKAAAQAIAEALAFQTREGRNGDDGGKLDEVNRMIAGLGSPISIRIEAQSPAVGKTLAEINLRGITGATVLAIERGGNAVLVPSGHERLAAGDLLAVAGTEEAVRAARQWMAGNEAAAKSALN